MEKQEKKTPFFLKGNYAPITTESSYSNLKVIQGKIPVELNGCLYRNGPNPQFPNPKLHWFEGDGMIHAITLQSGKASYQNRWIKTERFKLEQQHGRSLFASIMNPSFRNPLVKGVDENVANTNIIQHAGLLLALQEVANAIQMSEDNLETIGPHNFKHKVPTTSAHPRFDYKTGEMLFHSYKPFSKKVKFYIIDKTGNVKQSNKINAPYSSFMHDFVVTKNYFIFPILPLTFSLIRAIRRKPVLMWEPDLGSYFGVLPRDGSTRKVQWFSLPAFYAYHFMNAYEENSNIIIDGLRSSKPGLFPEKNGKVISGQDAHSTLTRWILDLRINKISESTLETTTAEFPRFDERYTGLKYHHGYAVGGDNYNTIIHYDLQNRTTYFHQLSGGKNASEPIFVPKNKDSSEGDGYLLSVVYDNESNSSVLLILAAKDIEQGPVATIALPNRVPNGFHGNWVNSY